MIGGDDTRTRVFFLALRTASPVFRHDARSTRDDPVRTHGKRRNEKGMEQAAPRHATTPVNAGSDPDAPQRRPMGRVPP